MYILPIYTVCILYSLDITFLAHSVMIIIKELSKTPYSKIYGYHSHFKGLYVGQVIEMIQGFTEDQNKEKDKDSQDH